MNYDSSADLSEGRMGEEKNLTILEHLEELRHRLIIIVAAVVVATLASIVIVRGTFDILLAPVPGNVELIYTEPMEMFGTYLKVALFTGLVLAMPVIVYQVAAFVVPGLTDKERRYLLMLLPGIFLMFIVGVVFSYLVVLPFATRYLLTTEFLTDIATPYIKISNYVGFAVNLLLAIGASFQLPVIIYFLARIGVVNAAQLARYRKYAILGAAVMGAIITPTPDPGTQVLVAVPLYFLFEIGILLARLA